MTCPGQAREHQPQSQWQQRQCRSWRQPSARVTTLLTSAGRGRKGSLGLSTNDFKELAMQQSPQLLEGVGSLDWI